MSRRVKPPPKKPSKAYLVSFGDTMTALLAFFIVLNSFASDQTGAKLHSGTGSFVKSLKKTGSAGGRFGTRSGTSFERVAHAPVYAVPENDKEHGKKNISGIDESNDEVVNRQADNFQRFLNEMSYRFTVSENPPTESQIVFDSFENLGWEPEKILGPNAIRIAADAITQLSEDHFELEIIVWSTMPADFALNRATSQALAIEEFVLQTFRISPSQRERFTVSAQPWLFVDAARPRMSFVLSRIDQE
jgi:hypothetical protein